MKTTITTSGTRFLSGAKLACSILFRFLARQSRSFLAFLAILLTGAGPILALDSSPLAAGSVLNVNTGMTYTSIQEAINAGTTLNGHTLQVGPGVYKENPFIHKSLSIIGANGGVKGSASRNAESVIQTNGNQANVILVSASHVTLDGFLITGDDPDLTGAAVFSGDDGNAAHGITTVGAVNHLDVRNSIIRQVAVGIRVMNAGLSMGNIFTRNWFDAIGDYDYGYGVSMRDNFYVDIIDNKMTRVFCGVHINGHNGSAGGPANWYFSDNEIHSYAAGLLYWAQTNGAAPLQITNNQFIAESGAVANNMGMMIVALLYDINPLITGNTISGHAYGIDISDVPNNSTQFTIGASNTISGSTIAAIWITDDQDINPVNSTDLTGAGPGRPSSVYLSGINIETAGGEGISLESTANPMSVYATGLSIAGTETGIGLLAKGNLATANLSGSSIFGFGTGAGISGNASANLAGNSIYDNGTGIRFGGGAKGSVEENRFYNDLNNGTDLLIKSDAGVISSVAQNWFAGTLAGVDNQSNTVVNAQFNYWNDASGPGDIGPGSGAHVSVRVLYCPWLNGVPASMGGSGVATVPLVGILILENSGVAANDGIICGGAQVTLSALTSTEVDYLWSPGGATTSSIIVNPASNSTYSVSVSLPGCSASDAVNITVNNIAPVLTASPQSRSLSGCSVAAISDPAYSNTWTAATQGQFQATGAAVTSICGNLSYSYQDAITSSDPCHALVTRTWRVSDTYGNNLYTNQPISVHDDVAPLISSGAISNCYSNIGQAEAAAIAVTSATDNCGGTPTRTVSSGGLCSAHVTVTYTDACGNAASVTYYTHIDTQNPVLTAGSIGPAYNSGAAARAAAIAATTISENCPNPIIRADITGSCAASVITVTVSDSCGRSASVSYNTKVDTLPPSFTKIPANLVSSCTATTMTTGLSNWLKTNAGAEATDDCGGVAWTNNYNETYGEGCTNTGVITITFTATDLLGNSSHATASYTVFDNTAPTLSLPPNITITNCNLSPAYTGYASASDVCSNVVSEPPALWINEFHYANASPLANQEFIEVAGTSGIILGAYYVQLYNEAGQVYSTKYLTGTVPNEGDGRGAVRVTFPANTLVDGIGGIALIKSGVLSEFISYGGAITGTAGLALGKTSVNVGYTESPTGPSNVSIQKTGSGRQGFSFYWTGPALASPNLLNAGQSIAPPPFLGPHAIEISYTTEQISGSGPCNGQFRRYWTATDSCGNMSTGTQSIRVNASLVSNNSSLTADGETESIGRSEAAEEYALFQNTPNPWDRSTLIRFSLPESMRASLSIFDINGKQVYQMEREMGAGINEVRIGEEEMPVAGLYYYLLQTADWSAIKSMLLIR